MRWLGVILAAVVALATLAGNVAPAGDPKPLNVVVTISPLKGLVEPLLPTGSTVTVLMKPGRSEHGYEFTPADVAAMAKADLFIYVGLGLEGRLEAEAKRQTAAGHRVLCFADAVGIKAGQHEDEHDEHAGHDEHDHHGPGYVDPHLWLDPILADQFIPHLADAVTSVLIANPTEGGVNAMHDARGFVRSSAASLRERVKAVDKEWTDRLAPLKGRGVVTHHNAFSRPSERYGFMVAAVIREFETSEPSPGDIAKVVEAIHKEHVKTIFVEPQFNAAAAERIAAKADVKIGHLDPLGDGDWFRMMKSNLDALVAGLSDDPQAAKPGAGSGGK